jgi:cobalt-zinc-cadmium efflux system outer membrane protein
MSGRLKPSARLLSGIALVAMSFSARTASAETLTPERAVAIAIERSRDVVAARLEIEASEIDKAAAAIRPNPVASYSINNLVLGKGNSQGSIPPENPWLLSQPVQTIGVTQQLDVWSKRTSRIALAEASIQVKQFLVEEVLRELAHSARVAAFEVARAQRDEVLARETAERYAETIRLSQVRQKAGEISEAEVNKIELEGVRYQTAAIQASLVLALARQRLASALSLEPSLAAGLVVEEPDAAKPTLVLEELTREALEARADLRAVRSSRRVATAALDSAKLDARPDLTVGAAYTHSAFTVSGDNPDALGLTVSMPVPVFDKNQAAIRRAALDGKRVDNEEARLALRVRQEVADAVRRAEQARALSEVYESGMIQRAEGALHVAERSYKAGAISLLELLEAQRTFIQVRGDSLQALYAYRQALVDVAYAIGRKVEP